MLDFRVCVELREFQVEVSDASSALQSAFNVHSAWVVWMWSDDIHFLRELCSQSSLLLFAGSIELPIKLDALLVLLVLTY